jgi:glutaconyl-CoA decarboxylase
MDGYSMPRYFQGMPQIGLPLAKADTENAEALRAIEGEILQKIYEIQSNGRSDESLNQSGQLTAWQRIGELIDDGTWCPLNSIFNPQDNDSGSTSIVKGLGRVNGRWAVIVASDNKKLAGAWVPGQSENLLRASDTAKCLHIPLIYLLNCAGVKFDDQHMVYPNRRGGGAPFYRNAELARLGIPVLVGVFGTNPAGGGYHSISPTVIIAHKNANMAVAGDGIKSGMQPKGYIDEEAAEALIAAQMASVRTTPPGTTKIHFEETGFMREIYDDDLGVADSLRKYMGYMPAYHPEFFRAAPPQKPAFPAEDLYTLIPLNPKRPYNIYEIFARLFDNSEFTEYKKGYGPEIVCGLARVNGLLAGTVANTQGLLMNYPEYRPQPSVGVGGKLYRQGLIKMSEFVGLCARDRIPIIWFQDTSGIDLDDYAEKAELLGTGQALIYSIQASQHLPQLEITLRKASAAAHYVMGGPQSEDNAFSIGTAASETYALYSETAAAAMYVRRLMREKQAGKPLAETIGLMNALIDDFHEKSRPKYTTKLGMVDEIVEMTMLRNYIIAFIESAYQNPTSICPFHQMLTVRSIADYDALNNK